MKGTRVTELTTRASLAKWFLANSGTVRLTPAEIYRVENLDASSLKSKKWLSNKLSAMRHYGLFERHYDDQTPGVAKRLVAISLTPRGKEALKAVQEPEESISEHRVTPDTVLRDVRILRKQMPLWDIIFELRPKDED